LIGNKKKAAALSNQYFSMLYQCPKDSISMVLDADDEFIGRNLLKVFNEQYQTRKSGVLYSNSYFYSLSHTFIKWGNKEYDDK